VFTLPGAWERSCRRPRCAMNNTSLSIMMLSLMLAAGCGCVDGEGAQAPLAITDILTGAQIGGYERVINPRPLLFPADHGAHPRFRNEWWYFTGNLSGENGREFGFQFTLFRYAVAPATPLSGSAWSTNQIYLAQLALSDISTGKYHADERFGRGAMGLAGVTAAPFHAWLDDWTVRADPEACGDCFAVEIKVAASGFKLLLHLNNTRPVVLQGDRGFSRKSPVPGNASYYYSYTRMKTSGEIEQDGAVYQVGGLAWYDHEWSTSSLQSDQSGWDWFALQLSNHSDLMVFRLRNRKNPDDDYYYGSLINPDGMFESLQKGDLQLHPLADWKSDASGVVYPLTWQLDIPGKSLSLRISPSMANQEMNRSFRYWEGAIRAEGKLAGGNVNGSGYMELTGY